MLLVQIHLHRFSNCKLVIDRPRSKMPVFQLSP